MATVTGSDDLRGAGSSTRTCVAPGSCGVASYLEDWEHHRFAVRDLAAVTEGGGHLVA
jgi:hypothetical protein